MKRQTDELCRVMLPHEIRLALNISPGDCLYCSTDGCRIILEKAGDGAKMKRKVDELGRIVIPAELRQKINISHKTIVDITLEDDKIILEKVVKSCAYCGKTDDLIDGLIINEKHLCAECAEKISHVFNCTQI